MSVFKTSNLEIEKRSYKITIKNIDLSSDHWGSEKDITTFLDDVESFTFDKDTFNKNILKHALRLTKYTPRLLDLKFFRVENENRLILLATTAVRAFKKVDILSREMSIAFADSKFTFSIIELLEDEVKEMKEKKIELPANWKLDDYLNDRYAMMKELV